MIEGPTESVELRLRAYRKILEEKARAYEELSNVTREGERPIERARFQAYKSSLKQLDDFFPSLMRDKPKN